MIIWTPALAARVVETLGRYEHTKDAAAELGIGVSALRQALPRFYPGKTPRDFLRRHPLSPPAAPVTLPEPAPEPPPLEAVRARETARAAEKAERSALREALEENDRLRAVLRAIEREHSAPLPEIPPIGTSGARRSGAAIILASDWHAGAAFEPSASTFGNRFNPEICRLRVQRFFAGIAWHVRAYRAVAWDLRHVLLWLGGDMIDGHLHGDQQETSQSAIETIDWLEPLILAGVRSLLDLEIDLQLVCSYGNHGRDTIKPRRQTGAGHSYEWGMYQRLGRALHGEVAVLADPTAHQYARVLGYDLHFTHGDEARYAGGVGGISIPLNKAFAAWDRVRRADYHHCGHFHVQLQGGNWFSNGTLKGYDPFGMSVKGEPQTPRQTFYVLDEKRGATAVTPLWVSDPEEEQACAI